MRDQFFVVVLCVCLRTQGLGVRVCGEGNWQLLLCVGECKDYFGVNFWSVGTSSTHSPTHR